MDEPKKQPETLAERMNLMLETGLRPYLRWVMDGPTRMNFKPRGGPEGGLVFDLHFEVVTPLAHAGSAPINATQAESERLYREAVGEPAPPKAAHVEACPKEGCRLARGHEGEHAFR